MSAEALIGRSIEVIRYVEPTEQLVVKIFARNLICSMAFYRQLGFELLAHRGSFVELAWEGHRLFLDERRDVPAAAELPQANIRIMVPDVDAYWKRRRRWVQRYSPAHRAQRRGKLLSGTILRRSDSGPGCAGWDTPV